MARPLVLLALVLGGCWGDVTTAFPAGLEPIAENQAPWPSPVGDDPFPETMEFVSGRAEDFAYGHGRGFVKAPIAKVWAAMQHSEINVDRRAVDEWTRREIDENLPGVAVDYVLALTIFDIITVRYDVTWRHGVAAGTVEDPQTVGIRFQKTFGFELVDVEGSFVLEEVDDDTTRIEMIEYLRAPSTDEQTVLTFLSDIHRNIGHFARGEPIPSYKK